ncbi:MAG TPA: hypothetical protein VFT74_09105 [Isosphaeraceae bacterium]|nr:hypothetical protein [Isosphaeraceae bacterium]
MTKLTDNTVPDLRERFRIDGTFAAYGSFSHPGVRPMFQYVAAEEEIVLHSWQLATHGWIVHNDRAHPRVEQRVYLIWQPYEAHHRQVVARSKEAEVGTDVHSWRPTPADLRDRWNKLIVPLFRQIESWGFGIEVIDVSEPLCPALPVWPD